ncbi:MAG: hypothetical protein KDK36_07775, partial [Leptospiraceae bacterium]|nr:hypothetical protein [Leptospiraceae bacterium]
PALPPGFTSLLEEELIFSQPLVDNYELRPQDVHVIDFKDGKSVIYSPNFALFSRIMQEIKAKPPHAKIFSPNSDIGVVVDDSDINGNDKSDTSFNQGVYDQGVLRGFQEGRREPSGGSVDLGSSMQLKPRRRLNLVYNLEGYTSKFFSDYVFDDNFTRIKARLGSTPNAFQLHSDDFPSIDILASLQNQFTIKDEEFQQSSPAAYALNNLFSTHETSRDKITYELNRIRNCILFADGETILVHVGNKKCSNNEYYQGKIMWGENNILFSKLRNEHFDQNFESRWDKFNFLQFQSEGFITVSYAVKRDPNGSYAFSNKGQYAQHLRRPSHAGTPVPNFPHNNIWFVGDYFNQTSTVFKEENGKLSVSGIGGHYWDYAVSSDGKRIIGQTDESIQHCWGYRNNFEDIPMKKSSNQKLIGVSNDGKILAFRKECAPKDKRLVFCAVSDKTLETIVEEQMPESSGGVFSGNPLEPKMAYFTPHNDRVAVICDSSYIVYDIL